MSKTISHYIARFNQPAFNKGDRVGTLYAIEYPDLIEPVYKEYPVVPPGIIRMTNGDKEATFGPAINHLYEQWYECFNAMGYKPHTISVNGTEWSVKEKVNSTLTNRIIDHFEWKFNSETNQNEWAAMFTEPHSWDFMVHVSKLPTRTPICQLPDENGKMVDIFKNDLIYYVRKEDYHITEFNAYEELRDTTNTFATLAAAEKYVLDNQPFYPRRLVEPVMSWIDDRYSNTLLDNLKAFKETHLKDKV